MSNENVVILMQKQTFIIQGRTKAFVKGGGYLARKAHKQKICDPPPLQH